jgi:hypothetical protein
LHIESKAKKKRGFPLEKFFQLSLLLWKVVIAYKGIT